MNKTIVIDSHPWTHEDKGVWIDIFPLDGIDKDYYSAQNRIDKIFDVWHLGCNIRLSKASIRFNKSILLKIRQLFKRIFYFVISIIFKPYDKHIELCKELNYKDADFFSNLAWPGWKMREYCPKHVLDDYILVPFEDSYFYVMRGYDESLRLKYGDYMQLPPVEKRIATHPFNLFYWK